MISLKTSWERTDKWYVAPTQRQERMKWWANGTSEREREGEEKILGLRSKWTSTRRVKGNLNEVHLESLVDRATMLMTRMDTQVEMWKKDRSSLVARIRCVLDPLLKIIVVVSTDQKLAWSKLALLDHRNHPSICTNSTVWSPRKFNEPSSRELLPFFSRLPEQWLVSCKHYWCLLHLSCTEIIVPLESMEGDNQQHHSPVDSDHATIRSDDWDCNWNDERRWTCALAATLSIVASNFTEFGVLYSSCSNHCERGDHEGLERQSGRRSRRWTCRTESLACRRERTCLNNCWTMIGSTEYIWNSLW